MPGFSHFTPALFDFLDTLALHNTREWFTEHKARYEADVRGPALDFVRAVGERLAEAESFLVADDRKLGGSLMRIYRDTRFGKDKTPYKTNVGIQFRHVSGKDVHAPGLYLHLAGDEIFLGMGMWRPDREPLRAIREAIAEDPDGWQAVLDDPTFKGTWRLGGESLKRAPRGFDPEHPAIAEIRRKDFIAICTLDRDAVTTPGLVDRVMAAYDAGYDLCGYLCAAIGQPF